MREYHSHFWWLYKKCPLKVIFHMPLVIWTALFKNILMCLLHSTMAIPFYMQIMFCHCPSIAVPLVTHAGSVLSILLQLLLQSILLLSSLSVTSETDRCPVPFISWTQFFTVDPAISVGLRSQMYGYSLTTVWPWILANDQFWKFFV